MVNSKRKAEIEAEFRKLADEYRQLEASAKDEDDRPRLVTPGPEFYQVWDHKLKQNVTKQRGEEG